MKLNIGAGSTKMQGYVSVDISPKYHPVIVCDVCNLDSKIEPDSIEEILIVHTLEHTNDFIEAMRQMHKALRKGGRLKIIVPFAACYSAFHPWHKWYFSFESFDAFREGAPHEDYIDFHFSDVKVSYWFGFFTRWLTPLANRFHWIYENTFISKLAPAREIRTEMVK